MLCRPISLSVCLNVYNAGYTRISICQKQLQLSQSMATTPLDCPMAHIVMCHLTCTHTSTRTNLLHRQLRTAPRPLLHHRLSQHRLQQTLGTHGESRSSLDLRHHRQLTRLRLQVRSQAPPACHPVHHESKWHLLQSGSLRI